MFYPFRTPPFLPAALFLAGLLFLSAAVFADDEHDLDNVRQAIEAAQKDLREKEAAQQQAEQTLRRAQSELEKVQRELEALNLKQQQAWSRLQGLQNRLTQLQTETAGTKAQVSRLLIANYKNRSPNAVVVFLKNADANQKSRFLNYTRYINQSNGRVLKQLTRQQKELNAQEAAITAELENLRKLTLAQQQKTRELGQNRSRAQTVARQINADINRQRQNLSKLREDEQRLNSVIAGISAKRQADRKSQAGRQAAEAQERARAASAAEGPDAALTAEDLALQNPPRETRERETAAASGFSRRQGRLPMPVQGTVAGQFGGKRASGGTWRGLFIATEPTAVKSIAKGNVEYAGNLPGFGNTVVIDHGDNYISVYTGLSRLGVRVGSNIAENQNIGTSGTLPAGEEGLYFELRYRNQPMNPRAWVR